MDSGVYGALTQYRLKRAKDTYAVASETVNNTLWYGRKLYVYFSHLLCHVRIALPCLSVCLSCSHSDNTRPKVSIIIPNSVYIVFFCFFFHILL